MIKQNKARDINCNCIALDYLDLHLYYFRQFTLLLKIILNALENRPDNVF